MNKARKFISCAAILATAMSLYTGPVYARSAGSFSPVLRTEDTPPKDSSDKNSTANSATSEKPAVKYEQTLSVGSLTASADSLITPTLKVEETSEKVFSITSDKYVEYSFSAKNANSDLDVYFDWSSAVNGPTVNTKDYKVTIDGNQVNPVDLKIDQEDGKTAGAAKITLPKKLLKDNAKIKVAFKATPSNDPKNTDLTVGGKLSFQKTEKAPTVKADYNSTKKVWNFTITINEAPSSLKFVLNQKKIRVFGGPSTILLERGADDFNIPVDTQEKNEVMTSTPYQTIVNELKEGDKLTFSYPVSEDLLDDFTTDKKGTVTFTIEDGHGSYSSTASVSVDVKETKLPSNSSQPGEEDKSENKNNGNENKTESAPETALQSQNAPAVLSNQLPVLSRADLILENGTITDPVPAPQPEAPEDQQPEIPSAPQLQQEPAPEGSGDPQDPGTPGFPEEEETPGASDAPAVPESPVVPDAPAAQPEADPSLQNDPAADNPKGSDSSEHPEAPEEKEESEDGKVEPQKEVGIVPEASSVTYKDGEAIIAKETLKVTSDQTITGSLNEDKTAYTASIQFDQYTPSTLIIDVESKPDVFDVNKMKVLVNGTEIPASDYEKNLEPISGGGNYSVDFNSEGLKLLSDGKAKVDVVFETAPSDVPDFDTKITVNNGAYTAETTTTYKQSDDETSTSEKPFTAQHQYDSATQTWTVNLTLNIKPNKMVLTFDQQQGTALQTPKTITLDGASVSPAVRTEGSKYIVTFSTSDVAKMKSGTKIQLVLPVTATVEQTEKIVMNVDSGNANKNYSATFRVVRSSTSSGNSTSNSTQKSDGTDTAADSGLITTAVIMVIAAAAFVILAVLARKNSRKK